MLAENLRAAYDARMVGDASPEPGMVPRSELAAALWSSDPLIAANLLAGYGSGLYAAPAGGASQAQMNKEVKDALAEEVKQQIAADKAAAEKSGAGGDETPPALDPKFRYFIVASNLDLTTNDGQECPLSQGDVIQRTSDTPSAENTVDITVRSSKKDDCAAGTMGRVDLNDLQEMHNHFREVLDAGMKALADNSGKNGVPKAPDTSTIAGEVPPPTPDANVDSDLQQQEKEADQTEAEVRQGSGGQ